MSEKNLEQIMDEAVDRRTAGERSPEEIADDLEFSRNLQELLPKLANRLNNLDLKQLRLSQKGSLATVARDLKRFLDDLDREVASRRDI